MSAIPTLDEILSHDPMGYFSDDHLPKKTNATKGDPVVSSFEELSTFVDVNGREPSADAAEFTERGLATRLESIRADPSLVEKLLAFDRHGMLATPSPETVEFTLEEILNRPDLDLDMPSPVFEMKHVTPRELPEFITQREPCDDFDRYRPLFVQAEMEILSQVRYTSSFWGSAASIKPGDFFILNGIMVYVAEADRYRTDENGKKDARARVIFSNGQQSNPLLSSLARALHGDSSGRRVSRLDPVPSFSPHGSADGKPTGTVYILRTLSKDPKLSEHRDNIIKIGVTNRTVESRIKDAEKSTTFLRAPVEIVATFDVYGGNPRRLEELLHRVFKRAQLDVRFHNQFGNPIKSTEWFAVPVGMVQEAIRLLQSGELARKRYDPLKAEFVER